MPKTLKEKAVELFEKETDIEKQTDAFYAVKDLVTGKLLAHQKELDDKSNEVQQTIQKIQNNG